LQVRGQKDQRFRQPGTIPSRPGHRHCLLGF
jgi:hypothetical protein